ncbi:lysozyme family protein [Enterococcus durans]|uniref:lysozyme family protein n=1 Tax=Enterococcus durans TaxID=53345 RepID=UPI001C49B1C9
MAIIEAETGENAPNTISDPYMSIEVGVKYFASLVKAHKDMDLLNLIQAYNFGPGFLSFSTNNYDLNC